MACRREVSFDRANGIERLTGESSIAGAGGLGRARLVLDRVAFPEFGAGETVEDLPISGGYYKRCRSFLGLSPRRRHPASPGLP